MSINVTSAAFEEGGMIPRQYSCDGADISPPLAWSGVPEGTKSIALICDDPDAPVGVWVHWVLYNPPPATTGLPEGVQSQTPPSSGAIHGGTDSGHPQYGGPFPPVRHPPHYFKLYTLDTELELSPGASKKQLLSAMEGHILAQGQLMGRYKR